MKKFLLFFTVILFCFQTYGSDPQAEGEFIIQVNNNPYPLNQRHEVIIKMELASLCWDAIQDDFDLHNITNSFPGKIDTSISPFQEELAFEAGWEPGPSDFALGNYKITAIIDNIEITHFYMDYRTSALPEKFNDESGGDVKIHFNINNSNIEQSKFYYDNVDISLQTKGIWDLKPWITNIKTGLEPLTPDNFAVSSSGSPQLSWNHSSSGDYITGYKVYRAIVNQFTSPPGTFSLEASLGSSITSYTDEDFLIGGDWTASYKIEAVNGNRSSEQTSYISRNISPFKISNKRVNLAFNLYQNYPNPFNPSTKIRFSLPETQNVSLIIYNTTGEQMSVLLNEIKEEGEYSIEFDGTDLPSGIYFYRMVAGNFIEKHKLILLK